MRYLPASLFLPLALAACHGQPPAAPVATGAPAAAVCQPQGDSPDPFVIDWPADRRGDLEVALKRGTVVLSLTCNSARILPDCTADGAYSYVGTTEREQVMSLESADEVSANLPLLAPTLTRASSSVDFTHGASLDVAMAVIGRRAAARTSVSRAELKGECKDATHFVREATLGAFAMGPSARGQSKGAADVFTRGAQMAKDGALEACRTAKPDSETPAAQCAAPVRVTLKALREEAVVAAAVAKDTGLVAPSCPMGMVKNDADACVRPAVAQGHVCVWTDVTDCAEQCQRGSQTSCSILGRSYQLGRGVTQDRVRATELLTKACTAGVPVACGRLGEMALETQDEEKGLRLLTEACSAGWAEACTVAGGYVLKHRALPGNDLLTLWGRACRAGEPEACWRLGAVYSEGIDRVPRNDERAAHYLSLACAGNAHKGCSDYAKLLDAGRGVPADPPRALALLTKGCDEGNTNACSDLAADYLGGHSVAHDAAKALALFTRGCDLGDANTCYLAGMQLTMHAGVAADPAAATALLTKACAAGLTNACAALPKASAPPH